MRDHDDYLDFNYAKLPPGKWAVAPGIAEYRDALDKTLQPLDGKARPWRNLRAARWRRLIRLRRWMDETIAQRGPGGALP